MLCVTGKVYLTSVDFFSFLFPNNLFEIPQHYQITCVITITGTEALFADLSQFPVIAIQIAFTVVVFPCLLLAYSGQAAYLMKNSQDVRSVFYQSIPGLL